MRAVGKRPAEVGDRAAFVSNRLQMALMREALACVEEGLVTREDLDEVVRSTFGFRLPFFGPFLIADMAGLDTYASVFRTLEREVGPAFAVPGALQELVDAGRVGTKSGEGFGTYSEADRDALLLERDRRYAALGALLADLPPPGVDADADRPSPANRPSPAQ
jgi:3-hydroxybutyryl-CoA dehydrogenase